MSARVLWDTPVVRGDAEDTQLLELLCCLEEAARRELDQRCFPCR